MKRINRLAAALASLAAGGCLAGNALAADFVWSFTTGGPPPAPPTGGPGGPVLVITAASNPFTTYYAEILRTEGLNLFTVADIAPVTAATLAAHDVAILGEMPLTSAQVWLPPADSCVTPSCPKATDDGQARSAARTRHAGPAETARGGPGALRGAGRARQAPAA